MSKVPLEWMRGFHGARPHGQIDPTLIFIHLHRWDYKRCLAKNRRVAAFNWVDKHIGQQTRCLGDEFDRFFFLYENPDGPLRIPDEFRAKEIF